MPDNSFDELNGRLSLVYTGMRRLARNILREIVGKVVDDDADTLRALDEIQRLAVLMEYELTRGNIDRFTELLSEHWALSKRLDPGSTNIIIDHIVDITRDLVSGAMICGAGGGGFMMMIRKRGVSEAELAARLADMFQGVGVSVYKVEII